MTAAPEDVTTTLLTDGALFLTALRIPTVPSMAKRQSYKHVVFLKDLGHKPGSMSSFLTS